MSLNALQTTPNTEPLLSTYIGLDKEITELAKVDYSFYVEYVHNGMYKPARHTEVITKAVQDLVEDKLILPNGNVADFMFIFMPPRHSKSMSVSETLPSWYLGNNPDKRVIEASYGDTLAKRFGKLNKRKIEDYGNAVFGIKLARDSRSVTMFDISGYSGGMLSAGITSGITGQGADLLIVDDPIKNRKEADSPVFRENIWNEWSATLLTRLQPGAKCIVILTRWHEDDLAGRNLNPDLGFVTKEEAGRWYVINMPAVCEDEESDMLGRKEGEPLWPEHGFNEQWAKDKERQVGERTWSALYQQRPTAAAGRLFKGEWWRFWHPQGIPGTVKPPDKPVQQIQSWDCTFKKADDSDFVAGGVWDKQGADMFMLDLVHDRMSFTETVDAVEKITRKWPATGAKLIEAKANGEAVIDTLNRRIPGMTGIPNNDGKLANAEAASVYIRSGNVFLPHPSIAPWVNKLIAEASAFPHGRNDDMVDQLTQAIIYYMSAPTLRIR